MFVLYEAYVEVMLIEFWWPCLFVLTISMYTLLYSEVYFIGQRYHVYATHFWSRFCGLTITCIHYSFQKSILLVNDVMIRYSFWKSVLWVNGSSDYIIYTLLIELKKLILWVNGHFKMRSRSFIKIGQLSF